MARKKWPRPSAEYLRSMAYVIQGIVNPMPVPKSMPPIVPGPAHYVTEALRPDQRP